MKDLTRWVSFAVDRLRSVGHAVTLGEMRKVIEEQFGADAVGIRDEELRDALAKLQGPGHPSATFTRSGASVTCTPMPEGWIPNDEFERDR